MRDPSPGRLYIVDDDAALRTIIKMMLADRGVKTYGFERAEEFLDGYSKRPIGCVLLDVRLPGMDGLELLERIADLPPPNPVIMLSGYADVPSAVRAVTKGALDFLQKPFKKEDLLAVIDKAFAKIEATELKVREVKSLTPREREILIAFREGESNKVVAARLGLSPRTVEMHRARIFRKLGVTNLAQALRRASDAGLIT